MLCALLCGCVAVVVVCLGWCGACVVVVVVVGVGVVPDKSVTENPGNGHPLVFFKLRKTWMPLLPA